MPNGDDTAQVRKGSQNEGNDNQPMSNGFMDKFFYRKAGMWTAIFTGCLVIFTGLLWKVSDRANETSMATQRAILNFSGPGLLKQVRDGKFVGVQVIYLMGNSGTTPANAGLSEWNISLGPTTPQKGTDFDGLTQSERVPFVLGPKGNFQMAPIVVSMDDLDMVAAGKKHLFFWGWATYRDIFDGSPKRLSEFCTEIDSITWTKKHSDPTSELQTSSPPCPTHNCYDQDCEDYSRRVQ